VAIRCLEGKVSINVSIKRIASMKPTLFALPTVSKYYIAIDYQID
jgi:hypothetical protein